MKKYFITRESYNDYAVEVWSLHRSGGRCHNLKKCKEASKVTEGKFSRMSWEGKQNKGN